MEQQIAAELNEYENLPVYPLEKLGLKPAEAKGENTQSLERLLPIVRRFTSRTEPDLLRP